MDHSYCETPWSLCENTQGGVPDLLTDHTYALPPGSDLAEIFSDSHDWCSAVSPQMELSPPSDDYARPELHPSGRPAPHKLDDVFTQIELRIRDEVEVEDIKRILGLTATSLQLNDRIVSGKPSEVFRFLSEFPVEDVILRSPEHSSPVPTQSTPEADTCPPLYVTVVQDEVGVNPKKRRKSKSKWTPSHVCDQCGTAFTRKFAVIEHKRMIHERNPRYKCTYCGHGFKRPALLRDHIYSRHEHVRRFICTLCQKGFIRRPDYLRHFARHHERRQTA
ncbi:unnamed protein product [Calicophoron daubneyi]|uniref:C2H2-type domain-containing protein n=1 Tax=Calicophoron daubneyi TaxID=300641 RepID=A0AAV2SW32_CALDB